MTSASTPLFSILVANYNNGRYISECLDSVLAQDYKNIEIIIVDDASTDNSIEIINGYLQKHQHIKLFKNEENQGVGYTKKRCIDEAAGEILGFVDPDDTITPDAVSAMIAAHQNHSEASLIYSDYFECDEQLKIYNTYKSKQVENGLKAFFNHEEYIGPLASFKKELYQKTKGINITLTNAEDQDLYFKLYDIGDCIHLPQNLYYYRIHHGGLSTFNNEDNAIFWRWKVIFQRAEEKNIDIEDYFWKTFVRRDQVKYGVKFENWFRASIFYQLLKLFK